MGEHLVGRECRDSNDVTSRLRSLATTDPPARRKRPPTYERPWEGLRHQHPTRPYYAPPLRYRTKLDHTATALHLTRTHGTLPLHHEMTASCSHAVRLTSVQILTGGSELHSTTTPIHTSAGRLLGLRTRRVRSRVPRPNFPKEFPLYRRGSTRNAQHWPMHFPRRPHPLA